jgi:hypothetical protein
MIFNNFMLHHTMSQNTDYLPGYEASLETSTTCEDLAAWNRNFDAMILRTDPANLSSDALRASILMKLHHAPLLAIVNGDKQVEGDDVNALYRTIVTLAHSLINATSTSTRTKANISSGLGIVSPLFVAISCCTVPELRRDALELLKAVPRREGLWDAEIVARIAIEVFGIEERENRAVVRGGKTGELDTKVQELRIQESEDHFGRIERSLKVDLDFERTNRVTGQRDGHRDLVYLGNNRYFTLFTLKLSF